MPVAVWRCASFPLKSGHGTADYLLYVGQKAAGVVEAKPEGTTLTGVEPQSDKYSTGLPDNLPAHQRPLPFLYESTGAETQFTNGVDPDPRSRRVFSFYKPEELATWLGSTHDGDSVAIHVGEEPRDYQSSNNLRQRLQTMPPLNPSGLWPVRSRVPGSGVRGRGSGERETTASSLAGKEESSRKEDDGGQGKDGPAGAIAQGGNGR